MISRFQERGSLIYVTGLTPEPAGDVRGQTRQVLEHIDRQLAAAGSSRAKLLTAQVRLSDMKLREEHDAAWHEWIGAAAAPVRAVGEALLPHAGTLVEIVVTARK